MPRRSGHSGYDFAVSATIISLILLQLLSKAPIKMRCKPAPESKGHRVANRGDCMQQGLQALILHSRKSDRTKSCLIHIA